MHLIIRVKDKKEEKELLSALSRLGFYWRLKEEKPADEHFPSCFKDFPLFIMIVGRRLVWSSILSTLPYKSVNTIDAEELLSYPTLTLDILYQEANLRIMRRGDEDER